MLSPIDEIKNRLDIVEVIQNYIKLQKAGANYRAVCPFHSEKKPSFFVSPARQIWHCFGCQKGGDAFGFVKEIEGVEFGDALRILARKAGIELKKQDPKIKTERQRLYEINELACRFFQAYLEKSSVGKEAKDYLLGRNILENSIKDWRLGYSPDSWQALSDFLVGRSYKREEIEKAGLSIKSEKGSGFYDRFRGRIIFPVMDFHSQVIGFGARVFKNKKRPDGTEEAKYVNISNTLIYDKSRVLYGINKAGIEIRKKDQCIIVEGYVDAIMAHQAGFLNVVAASGTALTNFQLNTIKRYTENLFTSFDMDVAGDSATKRGIELAHSSGFNVKVVKMPDGLDPADVISRDEKEWAKILESAKTIHDFYFEDAQKRYDKNTLDGKKKIAKFLLPVIKKIPDQIEKTFWVQSLTNILQVKEEDVLEQLKKTKIEEHYQSSELQGQNSNALIISKTRKELLEEQLAVLAIKHPQNLNLIQEEDFRFLSCRLCSCLSCFKENPAKESFPDDFKDFWDYVCLRAEVDELLPKKEIEKEFINCLRLKKMLILKEHLDSISMEIKKAEQEKNIGRIKELMQEFNSYSKARSDLEILQI